MEKKSEIRKMFMRWKLDACDLGGRMTRERVGGEVLSNWLLMFVVKWKRLSSRLMWVRVKIE